MKAAATLNANQKKETLAAKKQSKKVTAKVRSVLATPKKFNAYVLTANQCSEFEQRMLKYCQHTPVPKPKWSDLKKLSKEERRELRKDEKTVIPSRSHIALGINEVTKSLENKMATIVIISHDISPKFTTQHIHQMCELHKIPLLEINNFKEISKNSFGFSAAMMSFFQIPKEEQIFDFYDYIQNCLVKECVLPNLGSSDRKTNEMIPMETEDIQPQQTSVETKKGEISKKEVNLHLFRSDPTKRAFVPKPKDRNLSILNADFISLDKEYKSEKYQKTVVTFPKPSARTSNVLRALRIKKLIGNPQRKIIKDKKEKVK